MPWRSSGQAWHHPPRDASLQTLLSRCVLADIHYFALWIHDGIHQNLNACYRSNAFFTCSLYCKSIIFNCSFKNVTKRKSKTIEKRKEVPSKLIDLGLKTHIPTSCFRHHVLIEIWRCHVGIVERRMVFVTYSRHCFTKVKASKHNKKYHNPKTTDRFTKRSQTENINISLDCWQIHL